MGTIRGTRGNLNHIGNTPFEFIFEGGHWGQWGQLEVQKTPSIILGSVGYSPLWFIFRGGDWGLGTAGTWQGREAITKGTRGYNHVSVT